MFSLKLLLQIQMKKRIMSGIRESILGWPADLSRSAVKKKAHLSWLQRDTKPQTAAGVPRSESSADTRWLLFKTVVRMAAPELCCTPAIVSVKWKRFLAEFWVCVGDPQVTHLSNRTRHRFILCVQVYNVFALKLGIDTGVNMQRIWG